MLLKSSSKKRKNKSTTIIECLDENNDDKGFIDGEINTGEVLSTFSFGMSEAPSNNETSTFQFTAQNNNEITSSQTLSFTTAPRGLTPPINGGENFTVKRSYAMRPSTVRKLNELKAKHHDVSVLFNTIIDMAVSHYYHYIFNDNGSFSTQEDRKINS